MRNSWGIANGRIDIFRVPLKEPFITALGSRSNTVNVGVHLRLNNDASGYGEASGSLVMARLKPESMARVLRRELGRAVGQDARRLKLLVSGVRQREA